MTQVEFKTICDICRDVFTQDDLFNPTGVVRLDPVEGTESVRDGQTGRNWKIVGFGTGWATIVVHSRCLAKGEPVDG